MQRTYVFGEVASSVLLRDCRETETETEFVTDVGDIKGIIRRAITITWLNQAFTYSELADLLRSNDVQLPVTDDERDEWFDQVIDGIWHDQKDLARIALRPLPTCIHYVDQGSEYSGIVVPIQAAALQMLHIEHELRAAETIEPSEREPLAVMQNPQIAKFVFEKLLSGDQTNLAINVRELSGELRMQYPGIHAGSIRRVLHEMAENGYVNTYFTGKGITKKSWITMDEEVRGEIKDAIEDGSFWDSLEDIFANPEEVGVVA